MEPLFSTDEKAYTQLKKEIASYISIVGVVFNTHYYGAILKSPTAKELVDMFSVDEPSVLKALADIGFSVGFRRD